MSADLNRKNMLRFYDAIARRDLDSVTDIVAPDFVDHELPADLGLPSGFEGVRAYFAMFFQAFPDLSFDVHEVLADDTHVAARLTFTGTHTGEFMGIPATGRSVSLEFADFVRVNADGQAVEHWGYSDNLKFMQQLGVIPEDVAGQ